MPVCIRRRRGGGEGEGRAGKEGEVREKVREGEEEGEMER